MSKDGGRKLVLHRETVRRLSSTELAGVKGGYRFIVGGSEDPCNTGAGCTAETICQSIGGCETCIGSCTCYTTEGVTCGVTQCVQYCT